ncbi:MAG: hypothetical protein QN123_14155 [Armatimonadota bacterium]|nr:hypothetical protein [Armatimonadota bacterium]
MLDSDAANDQPAGDERVQHQGEVAGPDKAEAWTRDAISALRPFFRENAMHMDYLLARAAKV